MCLYQMQPPFFPFQFIIPNLPHKFIVSPFQLSTLSSFKKRNPLNVHWYRSITEARVASQEPHSQGKLINIPPAATSYQRFLS